MALTAYCKKCGREVEPAEVCRLCGTKLGRNAVHAAWCVERRPVADWMCWNAVMRALLPAALAVLLAVLGAEFLAGGSAALEKLFLGTFPLTLAILLGAVLLGVLLVLILQGRDLMDYVVDSRGIHVTRYLPEPTPLKLLTRLKSPALLSDADPGKGRNVIRLETRDLAWKDVARVQLWPEKAYVLFYAPGWWLRIAVRCTPFTWEDTMDYIREKLGRKKAVRIPDSLRVQAPPRAASRRRTVSRPIPLPAEPPEETEPGGDEMPGFPESEPERTGTAESGAASPEEIREKDGSA